LEKEVGKMKIAVLSPTVIETPPKEYGGIELLVGELVKELEKLNHEVTLFAKSGSYIPNGGLVECNSEEECSEKAFKDNFDIIHDWTHKKTSMNFSYFSNKIFSTPFYTDVKGLNPIYPSKIVANSFGENGPVVYPGIDISKYSFRKDKEDYFIYFGRIAPIKGVHIVITIAKRIGINLKIAGHEGFFAYDKEYIKMIKEMCSGKIEYIGSVSFNEKIDLLSHAKGFLFYPLWLESFGITVVESLLCGTPIITRNFGGPAEQVEHEVSGYLCSSPNEMEEYIKKIDNILPENCRKRGEYFSSERMALDYLKIYGEKK
jgi:glycosyltransferase involved in cell wall biosynthesis